jgi:putative oxidoreductase
MINKITNHPFWKSEALLIARFLVGGMFLMAAYFKFTGMNMTAGYIASVGLPFPMALAWIAAIFETVLGLALITGICFSESALLLVPYILFLAFVFHGPSLWEKSQNDFGFFMDHLTLIAGLLFMAAHGPGNSWKLKKFW